MASSQKNTIALLKQVANFIDSNPVVLATPPFGYAVQAQALKTAVSLIDQVAADRASGTVSKTAAQRKVLRHALRVGQLLPIRTVARILERTVVGMPHLVNLPKKLVSTQALINAATATAQDVVPYTAQFVAKGLPPNFLDNLNTAIQALQSADAANIAAKHNRTAARGQEQVAIREGQEAVTLLDVIIRRACDADPVNGAGTLAVWNTIVPPHSKADRTASNAVSGTTADVTNNAAASGTANAGSSSGSATSTPAPAATTSATPSTSAAAPTAAPGAATSAPSTPGA